jgi:hypothetical protein
MCSTVALVLFAGAAPLSLSPAAACLLLAGHATLHRLCPVRQSGPYNNTSRGGWAQLSTIPPSACAGRVSLDGLLLLVGWRTAAVAVVAVSWRWKGAGRRSAVTGGRKDDGGHVVRGRRITQRFEKILPGSLKKEGVNWFRAKFIGLPSDSKNNSSQLTFLGTVSPIRSGVLGQASVQRVILWFVTLFNGSLLFLDKICYPLANAPAV